jgi:hypothetical protein
VYNDGIKYDGEMLNSNALFIFRICLDNEPQMWGQAPLYDGSKVLNSQSYPFSHLAVSDHIRVSQ